MGARYDNINVSIPDYQVIPKRKNDSYVNIKGGDLTYTKFSFNMALAYNRYAIFSPYASFSQGFSIFDLGRVLRDAKADVLSNIEVDPVSTDNYEIGFNTKVTNEWKFRAVYFYSYSKLGSDLEAGEDGFWKVIRKPQKIYGFEITGNGKIIDQLFVSASYVKYEGKLKSDETGKFDTYMSGLNISAPKLSVQMNYKPNNNLNLVLYYIHTSKRDVFESKVDKNGQLSYKEGEGKVTPIDLVNLTASYHLKNTSLQLGIENLLNKTYYTGSSMLVARNAEYARGNGRYYNFTVSFKY